MTRFFLAIGAALLLFVAYFLYEMWRFVARKNPRDWIDS